MSLVYVGGRDKQIRGGEVGEKKVAGGRRKKGRKKGKRNEGQVGVEG